MIWQRRLAVATGLMMLLPHLSHAQGAISVDLPAMAAGQAPPGFEFARTGQGAASRWTVVEDPSAATGRAIAQTSTDATSFRFPLAIYQPFSAKDIEVAARFKPISGKMDQAGGIAVRVKGANDYYIVRANALENNVRFYRVVNGRREQLGSASVPVAAGQWHTLGLKAQEDRFTIVFNGNTLYTVQDRSISEAGKVALWTKADSVTHFEGITITPLD